MIGLEHCASEVFGVYLHELTQTAREETADEIFKRLLTHLESYPEVAKALEPYIELCLSPEGLTEENRRYWRAIELIQRAGLDAMLSGRDFLQPDVVIFTFPSQFVPFLDSLDFDSQRDVETFVRVCDEVGGEAFALASDFLVDSADLITEPRVKRVLLVENASVLPLIRIIVESGPDWVRKPVAKYIRRRNPPVEESAALRAVRPLKQLPAPYLAKLCVEGFSDEQSKWLRKESGRLLRLFLRVTAKRDDLAERRSVALNLLRMLPSWENLNAVEGVCKESKLYYLGKGKRQLRKAAREAYADMQGRLSGR